MIEELWYDEPSKSFRFFFEVQPCIYHEPYISGIGRKSRSPMKCQHGRHNNSNKMPDEDTAYKARGPQGPEALT